MRRVLGLFLAGLLLVATAEAKILVVMPSEMPAAGDENEDRVYSKKALQSMIINVMDRWCQPYDIVPPGVAKTEFCRTGVVTHLFGSSGAYTTSYAAVIHCDWGRITYTNSGGYNPDSLTLSSKSLLVPQLFFIPDADFATSTTCSLGQLNAVGSAGAYGQWGQSRYLNGTDLRYRAFTDEGEVLITASIPGGGLRIIIGARYNKGAVNTVFQNTNCVDCDSLLGPTGFVSGTDTATVWVSRKSHLANSQPIIACSPGHFIGTGMDGVAFLSALAHLDSLTGGGVFDAGKLPIKVGIQVRGGWRRNARHISGGIFAADSTTLKACMDSLATLRVPFAVGINMDSLNSYASDRSWWERAAPYVHYSPEAIPGATASAAANELLRTFADVDSAFGKSRTDHVLISPGFDWIPSNMTRADMSKADSMISYLADAGVSGVVTNGLWTGSRPDDSSQATLSPVASRHYVRYGRSAGNYLPNLVVASYADSGSARWDHGLNLASRISLAAPDRLWRSILASTGRPYAGAAWQATGSDSLGYVMPINARILTLHASDFGSGILSDAATRPSIPGWWQAKYLANGATIINQLANRTIIKLCYPDEVAAQAAGMSR